MTASPYSSITAFWLGPALESPEAALARKDWWYRGGPAVDDEIRQRFGRQVDEACASGLTEWEETSQGAFAMILLLDQFTRNLFRGTPDAWKGNPRAYGIVNKTIQARLDRELHPVEAIWLYHPFHHSERLEDQDRGLALLNALRDRAEEEWKPYVEQSIKGWTRHRNIVAEYGRFPHRNLILGRESTQAKLAYINGGGENFGQATPGAPQIHPPLSTAKS
jgi:uncharacterized protein (DUF924 family)